MHQLSRYHWSIAIYFHVYYKSHLYDKSLRKKNKLLAREEAGFRFIIFNHEIFYHTCYFRSRYINISSAQLTADSHQCAAWKMTFSLNRKSGRVRCLFVVPRLWSSRRSQLFSGFREDNVASTVIGDSRHACVSSTRGVSRSTSFQFRDKESCTEKKIDRRKDANQWACSSRSLASL